MFSVLKFILVMKNFTVLPSKTPNTNHVNKTKLWKKSPSMEQGLCCHCIVNAAVDIESFTS
jgi:hypothetical protein